MERLDGARRGFQDKEAVTAISRNQTRPADEQGPANLMHEMGSSWMCRARDRQSSINSNGWAPVREHEVTFRYLEQQ